MKLEPLSNVSGRINECEPTSSTASRHLTKAKTQLGLQGIRSDKLDAVQHAKVIEQMTINAKKSIEPAALVAEPTPYANETVPEPTQPDSTGVQAQTLTNSRATTTTKSTNKMKNKAIRGVEAQLIHIRDRDNKRKAVWLEPVFYEALARVTADKNQSQWLTDILVNVGDGNLASAVRCSIVKELLA